MADLSLLKNFFSLDETAKILAERLNMDVSVKDVIEFAQPQRMNSPLVLSYNFDNYILFVVNLEKKIYDLNPDNNFKVTVLEPNWSLVRCEEPSVYDIYWSGGADTVLKNKILEIENKPILNNIFDIRIVNNCHKRWGTTYQEVIKCIDYKNINDFEPVKGHKRIPINAVINDIEIVARKENIIKFINELLSNGDNNFTNEDYQNVLFSLKKLVCSKAKKWSQDEINNELNNALKGMSKRRLEDIWAELNRKFKS